MTTLRTKLGRLLLLGVSSATALVGLEFFLNYQVNHNNTNPFAHNPIIAAQMSESTFFPDPELGHRLTPVYAVPGLDFDSERSADARDANTVIPSSFIGTDGVESLEDVVLRIKDSQAPVVLNLGDSSTSGWDSNVVTDNRFWRERARYSYSAQSPFFRYETYSDVLVQDELAVVNAGVPGYTSFQGKRYLRRLFDEFETNGTQIDYVTIYFGNNESTWNGNTQDKYVLPNMRNLKSVAVARTLLSPFVAFSRVSVEDYEENLNELIDIVREYGAEPILIRPVIPKYWHPGLRAEGREQDVYKTMYENKGDRAIRDLEQAIVLYDEGERLFYVAGNDEHKLEAAELFVEAQDLDIVVPRIKPEYVDALFRVASDRAVPLVDVQGQIPVDDRSYFVDYCHPIKPANELIAQGIVEIVSK